MRYEYVIVAQFYSFVQTFATYHRTRTIWRNAFALLHKRRLDFEKVVQGFHLLVRGNRLVFRAVQTASRKAQGIATRHA